MTLRLCNPMLFLAYILYITYLYIIIYLEWSGVCEPTFSLLSKALQTLHILHVKIIPAWTIVR